MHSCCLSDSSSRTKLQRHHYRTGFGSDRPDGAGATLTLTKTDTLDARTATSTATGDFVFTALQPGPYTLKVQASGFKAMEKKDLSLSASERLPAGDIVLQVGSLTERINVTSEVTTVQTASSERSALIDSNQVINLTTRGRDVFGLLATLPGVVYDGRGADGLGVQNSPAAFSGARGVYSVANVDGISGNTRSGASLDTPVNMDSVAEVKVLLNNYQAEYGKSAARVINVITQERNPELPRPRLLLHAQRNAQRQQLLQQRRGRAARTVSI